MILEEERFNRTKKTKKFPKLALAAGLADLGLSWGDIDVLTTPWDVRLLRKSFASLASAPFSAQPQPGGASLARLAAEPDRSSQPLHRARRAQVLRRGEASAHRQRAPSPRPRLDVLCLAVRGGARSRHGRLRRRLLQQRLCGPGQPAGAHLVHRHHELGRARLHLRHRVSGLCRLRRRRQGDGARGVRRGHLRRAVPRCHTPHAGWRLCRQHGLFQLRCLRAIASVQAQVHRRIRRRRAAPASRSPTGIATWLSRFRP